MDFDVLICQYCNEEIEKKQTGFPKFCSECGKATLQLTCSICSAERGRNKKGILSKFCGECGYSFASADAVDAVATQRAQDPPKPAARTGPKVAQEGTSCGATSSALEALSVYGETEDDQISHTARGGLTTAGGHDDLHETGETLAAEQSHNQPGLQHIPVPEQSTHAVNDAPISDGSASSSTVPQQSSSTNAQNEGSPPKVCKRRVSDRHIDDGQSESDNLSQKYFKSESAEGVTSGEDMSKVTSGEDMSRVTSGEDMSGVGAANNSLNETQPTNSSTEQTSTTSAPAQPPADRNVSRITVNVDRPDALLQVINEFQSTTLTDTSVPSDVAQTAADGDTTEAMNTDSQLNGQRQQLEDLSKPDEHPSAPPGGASYTDPGDSTFGPESNPQGAFARAPVSTSVTTASNQESAAGDSTDHSHQDKDTTGPMDAGDQSNGQTAQMDSTSYTNSGGSAFGPDSTPQGDYTRASVSASNTTKGNQASNAGDNGSHSHQDEQESPTDAATTTPDPSLFPEFTHSSSGETQQHNIDTVPVQASNDGDGPSRNTRSRAGATQTKEDVTGDHRHALKRRGVQGCLDVHYHSNGKRTRLLQTNSHGQISAYVVETFMELKEKVELAQRYVHSPGVSKSPLTLKEETEINDAWNILKKIHDDYEMHINNAKTKSSSSNSKPEILIGDENRMRKNFNSLSHPMTVIFRKLDLGELSIEALPVPKQKKTVDTQPKTQTRQQSRGTTLSQAVTFKAVLSKNIQKLAEKLQVQPVVEIRGGLKSRDNWDVVLCLEERNGIWTGTVPISFTDRSIQYKYHVTVRDYSEYEWLDEYYGTVFNRHLWKTHLAKDGTVYDGVISWKRESSIWKSVLSIIPGVKSSQDYRNQDLIAGTEAMLPSILKGISAGQTAQFLSESIIAVYNRQLHVSTDFSFFHSSYAYNMALYQARAIQHEVFKRYYSWTMNEHMKYIEADDSDVVTMCASLVVILELGTMLDFLSKDVENGAIVVRRTMQRIGDLNPSRLSVDLIPLLSDDDNYISLLSRRLIEKAATALQQEWIALIPVIHLLTGLAKTDYSGDSNFRRDEWWGVSQLKTLVNKTKNCKTSPGLWDVWFGWLRPFFPAMPILPFTFIAILTKEQLVNLLGNKKATSALPLNGILACVTHYVKMKDYYSWEKNAELAKNTLLFINQRFEDDRKDCNEQTLDIMAVALKNVTPTFQSSFRPSHSSGIFDMISVYLSVMDVLMQTGILSNPMDKGKSLEHLCVQLKQAFNNTFYSSGLNSSELELWKNLFQSTRYCAEETLLKWWIEITKRMLLARLKQVYRCSSEDLLDLYCSNDFPPAIDEVIGDEALAIAEHILEKKSDSVFIRGRREKLGKVVDRAVSKKWKSGESSKMSIVKKVIEWGSFQSLWKFFDGLKDDQKKSISDENRLRLVQAVTALEAVLKTVIDSTISFGDFDFLYEHRSRLIDLCAVTDNLHSQPQQTLLDQSFIVRKREQEAYWKFCSDVTDFIAACRPHVTGTSNLDTWLTREPKKLKFCDTFSEDSSEDTTIFVTCAGLPDDVRAILDDFKVHKDRVVFYALFTGKLREKKECSLTETAEVYREALRGYNGFKEQFVTGTVSIAKLQHYIRRFFNGHKSALIEELTIEFGNTDLLTTRKKQIEICADLRQYHDGATVILGMRDKFNLTGEFSSMERILQSRNKSLELKDIGDELTKSAEAVRDISEEQIECLQAFLDCKDLVDWAKESVNEKDISNFVDVAGSTLGEDDLAAQKTSSLLNALTGYSPLIYHLKSTSGSQKFISTCTRVWTALKENKSLINDLRASASELEWLKKVMDNFGNVEIDSIEQANAINRSGIYKVGRMRDHKAQQFKRIEDVISLTCIMEELKDKSDSSKVQKKSTKSYTYSDLRDLQSKLTLVAGDKQRENQETIKRFNAMKDAVENLAKSYLDIRREGCIQFDELLVMVHCGPASKVGLELNLQSIERVMHCKNNRSADALRHCQDLYTFFNECVSRWQDIMRDKRRDNMVLNFYTTEQLVVLRKELGTFIESKSDDGLKQSLPLIAMIRTVTPTVLQRHIGSFTASEDASAAVPEKMDTKQFRTYEEMSQEERDLVDSLPDEHEDYTEPLAILAVNELGVEADNDEYMEWIRNNADTLQQVQMSAEQGEVLRSDTDVMKQLLEEEPTDSPLLRQLEKLWTGFIEQTEKSIRNLLSISHLVHVLTKLQAAKTSATRKRSLPDWLDRRKPRLLAVKEKMTYQMVLSIYECDRDYAYPTRNEVMICNEKTRCEEARLFLNRALADANSYYCMVNCHLLSYEVCRLIETRLTNTADDKVKDYGLAFIYAEEKKDARIRAFLDKNIVKNYQPATRQALCDYVKKVLVLPKNDVTADPGRYQARLIRSNRAGVGKTLQKRNLCRKLRAMSRGIDITIPVYRTIDTDSVISRLNHELGNGFADNRCNTVHIDIAHEVESGVDELLFNLIILRSIVNSEGVVWQAQPTQYYIIESMPLKHKDGSCRHEVLDFLPTINCITPTEARNRYLSSPESEFIGFDENELRLRQWQTVLKYLERHQAADPVYKIEEKPVTSHQNALHLLLKYCGLEDPTWSELRHYVYFLSSQLFKVDSSPFCCHDFAEDLPGFRQFVVQFMFRMAVDFATRSLKIAEETPGLNLAELDEGPADNLLDQLGMKRTWESGNHPYLFFNEDGATFTPLGFFAQKEAGSNAFSLLDCDNREVLVRNCISANLKGLLDRYKLSMTEKFDDLNRSAQLCKLRDIMVKRVFVKRTVENDDGSTYSVDQPMFVDDDDPDQNYVLTMDNAKKILAIHQRLRVNIPVIIMGETGCGKTKLIEFMSKLQIPTELKEEITSMVVVKIHGGTTEADIIRKVKDAQELAATNRRLCSEYAQRYDSRQVPTVYTILFLDEANTTEAIGLVKEILCDGRMRGELLETTSGLKIIAACNPYRRHTDQMIEKLKKAGLGYSVGETETKDRFGQIPMRHLVYRVQPLSQSLLPLVWDFGTLQSALGRQGGGVDVETAYIRKMVEKFNTTSSTPGIVGLNFSNGNQTMMVADILSLTQSFMRQQKDECSFVSLRDVQRTLDVANWFFTQKNYLFPAMDRTANEEATEEEDDEEEEDELEQGFEHQYDYSSRSIILALGVCYLARLEDQTREDYVNHLSGSIEDLLGDTDVDGAAFFIDQVERCQQMFIDQVANEEQHKNIAKNKALKENVFMMIVCIENRIPLFLVGKPGSSKSLSKAMVVDAMKGTSSNSPVLQRMKRTYMVSFQCSRHATPSLIVGVFNHCANFQKTRDMNMFVSVVVLDEVGLAEDSENMPLKALHPLLEDGCEGNKKPEPYMKCAFVGISNWALDPAKMNRGIFVQRGTPEPDELKEIAREICKKSKKRTDAYIEPLARAYLNICQAKKPDERDLTEFFGLRDFYSLMKMVTNFAKETDLNKNQIEHSVRRNFGGFDPDEFDPMQIFLGEFPALRALHPQEDGRPPVDSIGLIRSSLSGIDTAVPGMESRYLLILTENLSVLSIILDEFASHDQQPEVVFGSRFRDDVSYTQVCHNLYRIKTCMAMGKPVILLNLDDLYESLYDALNQYFSTWGDRKFVDIGLGTHRVKAFVHDQFRLVVIADKNKVHSQFPIPLINRLEKHYVSATSFLEPDQKKIKKDLEEWAASFVSPSPLHSKVCPFYCDGCGEELTQPYRLPCTHYIGGCCRERMFLRAVSNCPLTDCKKVISEEYSWDIELAALENRQYFENSTLETSFIGYSSEATAMAVRQAVSDTEMADVSSSDNLSQQLLERAKFHLLQCATGEAVLRLDKTRLSHTAKQLQRMYMHEQHHETLLQYLGYELSTSGHNSPFIQATSFAELMSKRDVELLQAGLKVNLSVSLVKSIYLKDFAKEDQFTDSLKLFYELYKDRRKKAAEEGIQLLLVQCESANENAELLDSVRYIIQRESEAAKTETHTVLLLNVPRGHRFTGYQGGKWRCVHIDDPKSPEIHLPSLDECLNNKPSKILQYLVKASTGEPMEEDEDDEPPPLEDEDQEEYPDFEMKGEQGSVSVSSELRENLHRFLIQCLPRAVSAIQSHQQTDRLKLMKRLLADLNGEFCQLFLAQAHSLLESQEKINVQYNWVKADAAKASNMKESETLRHALEDSLERAFVPALAAVISFTDIRENLHLMDSNSPLKSLWMQIFSQCNKLGLTLAQLTRQDGSENVSRLPKSYKIPDVGQTHRQFGVSCPFSWLAKDAIDNLILASAKAGIERETEMLVNQFVQTPIGSITNQVEDAVYEQMLMAYVQDFVYMSHPCTSTSVHWMVVNSALRTITATFAGVDKVTFVHVHLAFDMQKRVFENLTAVLDLSPPLASDLSRNVRTEIENLQKDEDEKTVHPCDLMALQQLLEYLSKVSMSDVLTRPESWVCQVENCKLIVPEILAAYETINESPELVVKCREIWMRLVVKKLYVLHVIIPTPADGSTGKRKPHKLAFFLRTVKSIDFYNWDSFQQIVTSLQKSVAEGIKGLHPDCPKKCPACKKELDSPVPLPCNHFLCEVCLPQHRLCAMDRCGDEIPANYTFTPSATTIKKEKVTEFKEFRKRLNQFFMNFVSEIVFSGRQEPDDAIIEWLLNCVTFGSSSATRQFSLFNSVDVVDPTPVLRSFLLKLLLQCNQSPFVSDCLDRILSHWTAEKKYQMQTMVLFMDCFKDIHGAELILELPDLSRRLRDLTDRLFGQNRPADLQTLTEVAVVQSMVSQTVPVVLAPHDVNTRILQGLEQSLKYLIDRSQRTGNQQPCYLMARQILTDYGEAYLKDLLNTPHNYLIPDNVKQDLESFTVPDVLSVYGGQLYKDVKSALDNIITESASEDGLTNAINQFKEVCAQHGDIMLQVLFNRVTRTLVQRTPVSEHVRNELSVQLNPLLAPQQQILLRMLLQVGTLPREMDVSQSKGINLSMLVLNMYSCMTGNGATGDLDPLSEIVQQPLQAAQRFLPTMADNQYEANREVIRKALKTGGENPTGYACANGHPYIVGNCGQLNQAAVCPECGAAIGRGSNNARINDQAAQSKRGHILGAVGGRPPAAPERTLNVLSCAVLRCITHLCMYTASLFHRQHLMSVIQPPMANPEQIQPFIEAHIQLDLQHISQCSALSPDECILLLHQLINSMKARQLAGGNVVLSDINRRQQWEQAFDSTYIKPIFTGDMAATVAGIKNSLKTADSVDVKRLLSTADKPVNDANILASPSLWAFKRPLTLLALQNQLQNGPKRVRNLKNLVFRCGMLRAVRYLPDIVQLLQLLADHFHSTMSREKACSTSIGQLCQSYSISVPQLTHLVHSFISAWNIYITYTSGDAVHDKLSMDSPVAMFVFDPHGNRKEGKGTSTDGESEAMDTDSAADKAVKEKVADDRGTASYHLVEFLVNAHSGMIFEDSSRPVIQLSAVNSSNIICVTSEDEILALVTSHSEYEVSGETKINYNWPAIEREVLQRYISNKPKINFTKEQLPCFVYQEDFNLHNQMQALSDTQELLSRELHASVVTLLPPRIGKLKDILKQLEVPITFLSVMSHIERDNSLAEYMESTFGREPGYLSKDIQLKHVKHVWLIVKYAQTDLLMRQFQEPFGDVDPKFSSTLDHSLREELDMCCTFNSPKTKVLLEELFKYIVLRLNKAAVVQGLESADQKLQDMLTVFIQQSANDDDEERMYRILDELPVLSDKLLVQHASKAWCYIWTRYTTPTG